MKKNVTRLACLMLAATLALGLPMQSKAAEAKKDTEQTAETTEETQPTHYEEVKIATAEDLVSFAKRCRLDSASRNLKVTLTDNISLADYPNHLSLFISAPLEVRIQRVAQRQNLTPEKARQLILKTDKRRASYYEYYSSKKWGSVDSYHFCIDSSYLGLGRTVELIQAMVAHKEHPIPSPTEEDPTRPRT